MRVDLEGWHYVLLTRIKGDRVYLFDPYYLTKPFNDPAFQMVEDHPCDYNRIVPACCMDSSARELYAFGPMEGREAILLFNEQTVLTADQTVEYVI